MNALPTFYKKIKFRSRTEARWAVFFDLIEFKRDYENQGYKLDDGECYLPDFELTLPNGNELYIEVKPENFDKFENSQYVHKLHSFANESGKDLVILQGNPKCRPYDVIRPNINQGGSLGFFQDYDPYFRICDAYWMGYVRFDNNTGAPEISWEMDARQIEKIFGGKFLAAIETSRNEKFGI